MTTPPHGRDENSWGEAPKMRVRPTGPRAAAPHAGLPQAPAHGWANGPAPAAPPAYGQPPGPGQQPQPAQQPPYAQQPHFGQPQHPGYGVHAAHGDVSHAGVEERRDAEAIRRQFIKHEASVRSVGTLYLLFAVFGAILGVSLLAAAVGVFDIGDSVGLLFSDGAVLGLGALFLALAAINTVVGLGIRRLDPKVRKPAAWYIGITSAVSLVGANRISALLGAYCLYMLVGDKSAYVFSEEYARIRALTPHVRYQSKVFLVVVIILLALVVLLLSL